MKSYLLTLLLLVASILFIVYIHEPNTKLYHITYMEKDEPVHPVLEKMLDFFHRQGSDINILRCDDTVSEIDKLYDFIHKPSLGQNDIVLMTTADTTVMVKSHKDIRKKFKLQQTPILFSGHGKNLESTMFLGRVWALRSCFSGYTKNIDTDSNTFWRMALLKHPELIKVDTDSHLFLYAEGINKKDIQYDRFKSDIHYLKTDTHPYFLSADNPEYLYIVVSRWKE